ncbi:MAG: TonB-dependent receptor [Bacteroidetes bacterium]|nr:MAG: TonB-dependent receptor [Bacteroidota bacterium]
MCMLRKIVMQLILVAAIPFCLVAQNTTAGLSGFVKASNGEPLVGATVTATHEPTGSIYRSQTRSGGRFDIANMNTGGPYTVSVSFVNFSVGEKTNIFLLLGESFRTDFVLNSAAQKLENVTVTAASAKRNGDFNGKGGMETSIGKDKMENLPTVGRNLSDYLRSVPQARLTAAEGGISIAGQNNRLNSFFIDGAVNNDVFGLAASGTNGGQAGVAPISIDAIEQFQVVISPYDVSLGNFTGGGINAVTRSGTNKTQGSLYYFWRNEDLTGETPNGPKSAATKLAPFQNKTYGFRFGGPIIKNKLFYFINAELQRDVRPQPFDINAYQGNTREAGLNALRDTLRRRYGYDAGGFNANDEAIEANRISAKFDWNINPKHKASLSYRYNDGLRVNTTASNTTAVNFFNNGFQFPTTTHSTSFELKSNFGRSTSNRLLVTYTDVEDDRGPINGGAFPRLQIFDGTGTANNNGIIIGPDNSSTINYLRQRNFSIVDRVQYSVGKHTFSFGTDNEFNNSTNAFIQNTFGNYQYNSLADFYANARPRQYINGFSNLDNKGDATASAAKFNTMRLGLFAGDEFKPTANFTLTYGVRLDYYRFITQPLEDKYTNDTALPRFAQFYDLKGARSGQRPNIPIAISPRVGFTWKFPEEGVTVRGGIGVYTGRIPLVWPGGVYNNNGINIGGFTANANANNSALDIIRFRPDPNNQWRPNEVGIRITKGGLNLIAEEFNQPQVLRSSLAFDKRFGDGWTMTLEGVLTNNLQEIYYTNINILPPNAVSAGPEARTIYPTPTVIPITGTNFNPYDNAILLSNNEGPKGYSYNLTFTIDKRFNNGFTFNGNYSFGNSQVVNEATSSVNLSQWRFMETANGRNFINRSISDFDQGHRVFAFASKRFEYFKKSVATTISLVYNGQSGNRFSYVLGGAAVRDDAAGGNDLAFVPTSAQIANMTFLSNTVGSGASAITYTPDQQRAALEAYIAKDKYLNSRRGQYAERNGDRLPFTNIVDFKIAQDFSVKVGKNRYAVQLTWDVFNFTNLINRDWGRNYFLANDNFQLLAFAGYSTIANVANTPTYRFNPQNNTRTPWGLSNSVVPNYSARWASQLGVRINFN